MTLRQMYNKIKVYNDIAPLVGNKPVQLTIEVGEGPVVERFKEQTIKDLRKTVNDTFFAWMAEPILDYQEYEFDQVTIVTSKINPFGETHREKVAIYVVEER